MNKVELLRKQGMYLYVMADKKRPKDANQLAKLIADIATGEDTDKEDTGEKNAAAAFLLTLWIKSIVSD